MSSPISNKQASPKILKAAFVAFYPQSTQPKTIVFQLNPDSIKRDILPSQTQKSSSGVGEASERISFVLSVDENMGDDFFIQNEADVSHGVLPFLSAIELLVYPADASNKASTFSERKGLFEKVNHAANVFRKKRGKTLPFVALLWGEKRIMPVKIQSIQIIEQAFDSTLHPIRASVKIEMEVLSKLESKDHPAIKKIYKNYQSLKVMLANGNIQPK